LKKKKKKKKRGYGDRKGIWEIFEIKKGGR
jgi:hypothetical protein